MRKVKPVVSEVVVPVAKEAINNGAQIELGTKNVKHHAAVNAWHGKSGLACLKCMGAFWGLHGQTGNWVELHGDLVGLNRLKGPWDEHVVCRCRGRGFLADMTTMQQLKDYSNRRCNRLGIIPMGKAVRVFDGRVH